MAIRQPPSPSPRPSPQGRGSTAVRARRGPRMLQKRATILPLPWGEGRGEGEGGFITTVSADTTLHCQTVLVLGADFSYRLLSISNVPKPAKNRFGSHAAADGQSQPPATSARLAC